MNIISLIAIAIVAASKANLPTSRNKDKKCPTFDQFKRAADAYQESGKGKPATASEALYKSYKENVCSVIPYEEQAQFLANAVWETAGLTRTTEDSSKERYKGRGFLQLTHDYNYRECSTDLFGNDELLKNPDSVANDTDRAWATAVWFWEKRVAPTLGANAVKDADLGVSIKIINGGVECPPSKSPAPEFRRLIYKGILSAFGLSGEANIKGCN